MVALSPTNARQVYQFYPQYRLTTQSAEDYAAVVLESDPQDTRSDLPLESLLCNLQARLQQCAVSGQLHVALQACRAPADAIVEESCWENVSEFDLDETTQDVSIEYLLSSLQMGLRNAVRTGSLQSALQASMGIHDNVELNLACHAEVDAAAATYDKRYEEPGVSLEDLQRRLAFDLLQVAQKGYLMDALAGDTQEVLRRRLSCNLLQTAQNGHLKDALMATPGSRATSPEDEQEVSLEALQRRLSFNLLHLAQNGCLKDALMATPGSREENSAACAV